MMISIVDLLLILVSYPFEIEKHELQITSRKKRSERESRPINLTQQDNVPFFGYKNAVPNKTRYKAARKCIG